MMCKYEFLFMSVCCFIISFEKKNTWTLWEKNEALDYIGKCLDCVEIH